MQELYNKTLQNANNVMKKAIMLYKIELNSRVYILIADWRDLMKKFEYDFLLGENKFYTHYISEQYIDNITMKNVHNHSHYEILYILDGERILFAEKKQYILNKNSVALVPPYTLHKTVENAEHRQKKYRKYMINFTKDFIGNFSTAMEVDVFSAFQQNQVIFQLNDEEADFVKNIMMEMLKYNDAENSCDVQVFRLLLCSLLTFFAKKSEKETVYNDNVLTDKIVEYLEKNYEQEITLDVLARHFYISKYEISRIFAKNVGISFVEYLTRVRVENSKKLLRDTPLSITQISELTGFNSSSNFARVFKKITSVSPVQYRKNTPIDE